MEVILGFSLQRQGIIPEGEWDAFLTYLRKSLPTTFRINGHGDFAHEIRNQMQKDFFDFLPEDVEVSGFFCRYNKWLL